MKKIVITQILIVILLIAFNKMCEVLLNGPCVWGIQDVIALAILDTVLIIKQMK